MGKATIYGKKSWEVLEIINDVEDYYCIDGVFYIKAKDQVYYFILDAIGAVHIDEESEDKDESRRNKRG